MLMLLTGEGYNFINSYFSNFEQGSFVWFFIIIIFAIWPLLTGFILDMAAGDPRKIPHPIRLIGWLIKSMEKLLRPEMIEAGSTAHFAETTEKETAALRRKGIVLAISVPLMTAFAIMLLLLAAWRVHFAVGMIAETILCWLVLAARSLKTETIPVQDALESGNLGLARERLSWLVGRDTAELSSEEVIKATVETIAENTNDGVVAPLFYLALGGPVLGIAYKAINTLDSMVGYKNTRYLHFGRASARLDDFAGFIPARLAALMMTAAAAFLRLPWRRAWSIYKRDRQNHLSPNSAQTEAVCAGALGIQLGGSHLYGGKLLEKPSIGDSLRSAKPGDIASSQQLMLLTSILSLLILSVLSSLIFFAIMNVTRVI